MLGPIRFLLWNSRSGESAYVDDLYWFEENQVHNQGDGDWWILGWECSPMRCDIGQQSQLAELAAEVKDLREIAQACLAKLDEEVEV